VSLLRLIGLGRAEPAAAKAQAAANARRHGRVRCEGLDSSLGEILDMSASGTRVALNRRASFKAGELVELTVETLDVCIRMSARVVWTRRISARRSEAGFEFLNLTGEVRQVLAMVGRAAATNETLRPPEERAA
jgi:hypothetical protein